MTDTIPSTISAADLPERGQPLAGGAFVDRYWLNGQERALVLLPADIEFSGEWGKYGLDVEGANSYSDGEANTRAMVEAGSPVATKALELGALIPSCLEGQLVMAAKHAGLITDLREDRWYWLSSQFSSNLISILDFEDGWQSSDAKGTERLVRPVRSLLIQ